MNSEEEQSNSRPSIPERQNNKTGWLRILLVTTVIIALCFAGILTLLFTVESATLKPLVERIVTNVTGRAFIVEGDFEVDLGRRITVRADGLKMANAAWSSEPFMLTVEQPYVVLDVGALAQGQILIRDVKVKGGRLIFEESPERKLNWDLSSDDSSKSSDKKPLESIPLLIENAELQNVAITLDLPVFKAPLLIRIESAKQVNGDEDILDLVIAGFVKDSAVDINAHIGPFTTLLVGQDINFDIDAKGSHFSLTSNGHIDNIIAPKKPDFELEFTGPDATKLTEGLGMREVTRGPVSLLASIKPTGKGYQAKIDGDLGEFLLDLSADFKALNTIEGLKLDLEASGPDLSVAGAVLGIKGLPGDAYTLTGQIEESGGALSFREVVLTSGTDFARIDGVMPSFPKLDGASLTAGINGPDYLHFRELLGLPDGPEQLAAPFEITGEIRPTEQGYEIVAASAKIGEIQAALSGTLTNPPDFFGTRVDIQASGPDVSVVDRSLGLPGLFKAPFDARVDVEKTENGWQVHESTIDLGENTAEFSGLLGYELLVRDSDFTGRYVGNLEILAQYAQLPDLFPAVQYDLSFRARGTRDGMRLDYLDAIIDGNNELKISGMLGRLPSLEGLNLEVSANAPDLTGLTQRKFPDFPTPEGAFELSGRVRKVPVGFRLDKVITSFGNNRLNLSGTLAAQGSLAGTDIEFDLSGPNLAELLPADFTRDFDISSTSYRLSAELNVTETFLALQKLVFTGALGKLNGEINLQLANIPSAGNFSLTIDGKDLDEMIPNTPRFEPASVPFQVRTKGQWSKDHILFENLDVNIDGSTMDVHGKIDLSPDMRASNFTVSIKGRSLASIGSINGRPLPDKTFDLDVTLEGDNNTIQIENLTAHVGDSDLKGEFRLDTQNKPKVTAKFISNKIDFAQFFPPPNPPSGEAMNIATDEIDAPEAIAENAVPDDDNADESSDDYVRLIPDRPLSLQVLDSFDLVLNADAGMVLLPRVILRKFDLDANLTDGNLSIEKLSADTERGDFVSTLSLVSEEEVANLSFAVDGGDVALGLGDFSAEDVEMLPTMNLAIKLSGSGTTSRELVASLNGYADIFTQPGKIKNGILTNLFGDFFNELITRINPFSTRDPYTDVVCGAYFVTLADGQMNIDPGAVLQTDKMNLFGKGSVDLTTEKVNLKFDTAARKGIGISAGDFINPFIRIGGTLAEPKLRLDARSSAIEGGAAVATVGLSVVAKGLWGRWFRTKDPCGKFIQQAEKDGRVINVAY
jgi:uncharacterized protein involved in outer membrane biogenesis